MDLHLLYWKLTFVDRALPYLAGRVFEAGCSSQGIKFLEEMITRKVPLPLSTSMLILA